MGQVIVLLQVQMQFDHPRLPSFLIVEWSCVVCIARMHLRSVMAVSILKSWQEAHMNIRC